MEDAENWEFVNLDDERIGIKTSTLEEKSTACEMLCVYAKEMRGGFAPYLQEASDLNCNCAMVLKPTRSVKLLSATSNSTSTMVTRIVYLLIILTL